MLRKIPRTPFKVGGWVGWLSSLGASQEGGWEASRDWHPCPTPRRAPAAHRPHPAILHAARPQVLDAPALADDYYLNLVDWSAQNTLAVGLGTCVYLWSACTSKVTRLVDFGEGGAVCRWAGAGG